MHIVCPHCTTSYAVDPANFSDAGRRVRCARCQEVWLAKPQEMATAAPMASQAMATARSGAGFGSDDRSSADEWQIDDAPHVDSPSISADWPEPEAAQPNNGTDSQWPTLAQQDAAEAGDDTPDSQLQKPGQRTPSIKVPTNWTAHLQTASSLPTLCVALGAMTFALIAWRSDVVRFLPQTAPFFKMAGMGVNLRGLSIEDVKITTETVDNKPVLLIEGAIVDVARKAIEIPRLRFIVRDAKGADIYAWNAVLEQPVLQPGEIARFKTRLASPPAEGREIAVRFFHKQDLGAGGT